MNTIGTAVALGCTFSLALAALPARANTAMGPPCVPGEVRGGMVYEHSPRPNVSWDVYLTGADGKELPGGPQFRLTGMPDGNGGSRAQQFVDKSYGACDAINRTVLNEPVVPPGGGNPGGVGGGGRSDLHIESYYRDPVTGLYYLGSIFDDLLRLSGGRVRIPDLFADTNGDGVVGDGDVLYSLVDFPDFIPANVTFSWDQAYTVVNGQVAGLPGMYFSTTPFVFNPNTGFDYTPYSGDAAAYTDHLFEVPEPGGLALLAAGIGLIGWQRRGRRA